MRHSRWQPVVYVDAYQCPPAEAAVPADCRYAEGVAILIDEGGVVTGPVGTTVAGELSVDVTIGATVSVSVVPGTGPEGQVAVADVLTLENVADGTTAVFVFVPMSSGGDGDGETGGGGTDGGETGGGGTPDGEPGNGTGGDGSRVGNEEPSDPPTDTTEPGDDLDTGPAAPDTDTAAVGSGGAGESGLEDSSNVSGPTTPGGLVSVAGLPSTGAGPDSSARMALTAILLAGLSILLLGSRASLRCQADQNR